MGRYLEAVVHTDVGLTQGGRITVLPTWDAKGKKPLKPQGEIVLKIGGKIIKTPEKGSMEEKQLNAKVCVPFLLTETKL